MSDAEWVLVRDLLPVPGWPAGRGGRPEGYCHRQMIDAVCYLVDNGIRWRAMPSEFPPWPRVYAFFTRWRDAGLVTELHERLREAVRTGEGRSPEPSAGIVDSQSVKADTTVVHASRGFDAGKKVNGRKRHLLTDTLGLLLNVLVTPASTTDRDAARTLLPAAKEDFRRLARVRADGGYTGHLTDWTSRHLGLVLDIVRRHANVQGSATADASAASSIVHPDQHHPRRPQPRLVFPEAPGSLYGTPPLARSALRDLRRQSVLVIALHGGAALGVASVSVVLSRAVAV
ncbi:transposase [Streptomyces sp. SAI-170]|uniref:IS5 family transposase n=1 Tax=Streptomyces sp. SAI-170 TaxID=3377729 RepID=UPI003C7A6362